MKVKLYLCAAAPAYSSVVVEYMPEQWHLRFLTTNFPSDLTQQSGNPILLFFSVMISLHV